MIVWRGHDSHHEGTYKGKDLTIKKQVNWYVGFISENGKVTYWCKAEQVRDVRMGLVSKIDFDEAIKCFSHDIPF